MAALEYRKRKQNVRSSSSCSSVGFNEYDVETGYISDNSRSDTDITNRCREYEGTAGSRKRAKCTSKNAINARMNREKKKQHLNDLVNQAERLSQENLQLKDEQKRNQEVIHKLREEVKYLRSVFANRREIGTLLKCIRQSSDLPLCSLNTFAKRKSESQFDADLTDEPFLSSSALRELSDDDLVEQKIAEMSTEVNRGSSAVGVCLHVSEGHMSLEFCSICNDNATASWEDNTG